MTTSPSRRQKKLYKDPNDKMIAGVASGVAKYFDVDTTLVRALWVALALVGGFGILLYVILWIVLEDEPVDLESPTAEVDAAEAPRSEEEATAAETDEGGEPSEGEEPAEIDESEEPSEGDAGEEGHPEAGNVSAG